MNTEKSTFRVLFLLRKTKSEKNGGFQIIMRITVDGLRAEVTTHRSVEKRLWSQDRGIVIGNTAYAKGLNDYLDSLKLKLFRIKVELENNEMIVTARILADLMQGRSSRRKGIIELFEEHNQQCRELSGIAMAPSTVTRYKTAKKHIKNFIKIRFKQEDIPIQLVNYQFIKDFEHYLRTKRKCSHNTTVKYIKNFRKIIRIGLANDYIKKDPFRNIKYHMKDVDRDFLSDPELQLIINKKFPYKRLNQVKDIFLFCCFTGLAFSDVESLTPDNISIGIDNQKWLRTKRKKTGNTSEIPLFSIPVSIIKKYENDDECKIKGKLLPVGSNQKMNAYLKEIAELCGINKHLCTHTARHTFATTVTLTHGVSIEAVSKMLGHSSITTTKQYARIVDTLILDEMKKIQMLYPSPDSDEAKGEIVIPRTGTP